ncbi:MarR family transcriptional regulator [Lentzea sp. NPDC004782]|uniref:MarR family winged helix-turn-helix transcriptional regulator n=1 Tax=Lentzea sp. NPDC004782 TaxID=3154458 RepID=UPI0033A4E278
MDALTTEVIGLIARIVQRYTKEYEQAASSLELTSIQAKVLVALDEPKPMHRIAEKLGSERSNVTGIIDRLEARGLVERRPGETDRRVKYIVRTELGEELTVKFQRQLRFAADPLASFGTADKKRLRDLLQRMLGEDLA